MFQQPIDFKSESDALYDLLKDKTNAELSQKTQFKNWSINDVITHLHTWNYAADLSIQDEGKFMDFIGEAQSYAQSGDLRVFENKWIDGLQGTDLINVWHNFYNHMANRIIGEDPKRRVRWAGPDMSIMSSITARLMETWAHGQEIYDVLGMAREDTDRIKNIAILGINTFGWTYMNRKMDVPKNMPYVRLTAPSGEIWQWNNESNENCVVGSATEFCQIVTMVRNIADTSLRVEGEVAAQWMSFAQCFAGPPETPPSKGVRHIV